MITDFKETDLYSAVKGLGIFYSIILLIGLLFGLFVQVLPNPYGAAGILVIVLFGLLYYLLLFGSPILSIVILVMFIQECNKSTPPDFSEMNFFDWSMFLMLIIFPVILIIFNITTKS